MFRWLTRIALFAYLYKLYRASPRLGRAVIAALGVFLVGALLLIVFGLLSTVSRWAGWGFWGVGLLLLATIGTGIFVWIDAPSQLSKGARARRGAEAERRLGKLPTLARDDRDFTHVADLDEAEIRRRLHGLLRDGRIDEADRLLERVKRHHGRSDWWAAFRRQIDLRR